MLRTQFEIDLSDQHCTCKDFTDRFSESTHFIKLFDGKVDDECIVGSYLSGNMSGKIPFSYVSVSGTYEAVSNNFVFTLKPTSFFYAVLSLVVLGVLASTLMNHFGRFEFVLVCFFPVLIISVQIAKYRSKVSTFRREVMKLLM